MAEPTGVLGMIAGNGRFPVLALEAARKGGLEVVAIGIKEEASKEIEPLAARSYWISLGALSRLIDICKREGITQLMMCGQVKHAKIFSSHRAGLAAGEGAGGAGYEKHLLGCADRRGR